jgi:hypothetical protein
MTHPNKQKGNRFERECVDRAKSFDLDAKRSWGSDGRSLGLDAEVDIVVEGYAMQCKIRKQLPKWIVPADGIDAQVIRANRTETYAIIPLPTLLELMRDAKHE